MIVLRMSERLERCCMQCRQPLKGRADKKFCHDGCRNEFFNEKKKAESEAINKVVATLKRNRRILESVLQLRQTTKMPRASLLRQGYDFSFHTHLYGQYTFCFDYGYKIIDDADLLVVKAQNYIKVLAAEK